MERFYDSDLGQIKINNFNLNEININWLRSQIGLVSQEPLLFDSTIYENIAYGDNTRLVTLDECIQASIIANAHDFISKLPQVYNLIRLSFYGNFLSHKTSVRFGSSWRIKNLFSHG